MEDYLFTTEKPTNTNEHTMRIFLDDHFYENFSDAAQVVGDEGAYLEVEEEDEKLWGVHASGDGDSYHHRITFELLS